MKSIKLKLGDKAYIHGFTNDGTKTEGKVVHIFTLDWGNEFYVIEIDTHVDPVLVVRETLTVSDDPDKPIGFYRRD